MEANNNLIENQQKAGDRELKKEPNGIGGWLILVLIGLILSPISTLFYIFSFLVPSMDPSIIKQLNIPGLSTILYMELIGHSIFVLFALFLLILMFKKHKLFPRLAIIFLLSSILFILIDIICSYPIQVIRKSGMDDVVFRSFIQNIISAAIWIPYFIFSKRVRNTFL